jgi:selenocysteine lyase/cysteine desulfurase
MSFKQQFPILDSCTYLNTANSGILSQDLVEWRRAHDEDFLAHGSTFRLEHAELLQELKKNLSRFFAAKVENTYLISNFSSGFNTLLTGLPANQRFLLLEGDYPSVNYPIMSRGFPCSFVSIDDQLEDNILEEIKRFKPTVLAFSIVQYINGIKIDLHFLKELKRQFPDLLIVADGTQYCGTEEFNFEASGIDVLIASGYKWMLGGYGNGFLFMKDEVAFKIFNENQKNPRPLEPFIRHKEILSLCFEPGHQDTLAFGTLNQALLYQERLGKQLIENQIKSLSVYAKSAFGSRGLLEDAVVLRKGHSSIFNLKIPNDVSERLQQANIVLSSRGNGIRVSMHFYNTVEELDYLLAVIDQPTPDHDR